MKSIKNRRLYPSGSAAAPNITMGITEGISIIKDYVYILVIGGGGLASLCWGILKVRDKFRRHGQMLADHEKRLAVVEACDLATDRKIDVLHKNLVRLLENFNVEPVRDLFDDKGNPR